MVPFTVYRRRLTLAGKGSFKRMKTAMTTHVERQRDTMFRQSAELIQASLKELSSDVKTLMDRDVTFIRLLLKRDCATAIGLPLASLDGGDPPSLDHPIPGPESETRKTIFKILDVDNVGLGSRMEELTEHDGFNVNAQNEESAKHDGFDVNAQNEESAEHDGFDVNAQNDESAPMGNVGHARFEA